MKLLLLADREPTKPLNEIIDSNPWIDLIILLWDLYYMDIQPLKDYPNIPKIWVYGNHCDWIYMDELWIKNMHLNTFELNWITFGWFEWCVRYKDAKFQYTQEMAEELIKSLPKVDILVCHCPPFWINDDQSDHAHIWYKATLNYINEHKPKYLFHWHTYDNWNFVDKYGETNIVYVHREKILEI